MKLFAAAIGINFIRSDFPENDAWCRSQDMLKRRGNEHSTSRTFPKTVHFGKVGLALLLALVCQIKALRNRPFPTAVCHTAAFGKLQFRAEVRFTADFGEAAQCGQHFIPGWGPW